MNTLFFLMRRVEHRWRDCLPVTETKKQYTIRYITLFMKQHFFVNCHATKTI